MRRTLAIVGILAVLLLVGALPAFASDSDLLGSGATAPDSGGEAAAPVEVAAGTSATTAGEDVLAATGLDSAAALTVGLGLMAAGGAAVVASRKRRAQ